MIPPRRQLLSVLVVCTIGHSTITRSFAWRRKWGDPSRAKLKGFIEKYNGFRGEIRAESGRTLWELMIRDPVVT
jgi:hypothetical protein